MLRVEGMAAVACTFVAASVVRKPTPNTANAPRLWCQDLPPRRRPQATPPASSEANTATPTSPLFQRECERHHAGARQEKPLQLALPTSQEEPTHGQRPSNLLAEPVHRQEPAHPRKRRPRLRGPDEVHRQGGQSACMSCCSAR